MLQGDRVVGAASVEDGKVTVKSSDGQAVATRSENGVITEVKGKGSMKDARIVKDGDLILGAKDRDRIQVDDKVALAEAKARYDDVMKQLEQVEPGFAQKHPTIAAVLEYASANPRLLTGQSGSGFLQGGTLLATTGGAMSAVSALGSQAVAINLANSARALGAAALSAQAAAQASAQAGNLAQAGAFANDARQLAAKAHLAKDEAIKTGGKAMQSANLARVLAGAGGALQIMDGVIGYKAGKTDRSLVAGARAVTQSSMENLTSHLEGKDKEEALEDYTKVMKVMDMLQQQADKKVRVGGLKIGLGGLMVVSALLGPQAPPILGAIGMAGTAGTAVYEHWGPIKSFLTGESNNVPTFLDILPKSDEVVIHLEGVPVKKNK